MDVDVVNEKIKPLNVTTRGQYSSFMWITGTYIPYLMVWRVQMCVIKGGDVELNDKVDHHNIGFGAEIKCKQPIINFTIECK